MPLTITSANDVNTLLRWFLGIRDQYDTTVDDNIHFENAREAAVRLDRGPAIVDIDTGGLT